MPTLFIVIIVFSGILILNRLGIPLYLSIFCGAVLLGLFMRYPLIDLVMTMIVSSIKEETIRLVLIVVFILTLSQMMNDTGQMRRIIDSFHSITTSHRVTSSLLPALIGILPMPGGALFSAPMVDESLSNAEIPPAHKTAINYWFRHVWEYWWPLYPGVILAINLLHIEVWQFMIVMLPFTFFSISAGYLFLLKPLSTDENSHNIRQKVTFKPFFTEIMPILVIVITVVLISSIQLIVKAIGFQLPLSGVGILLGLCAGIIWTIKTNRLSFTNVKKALLNQRMFTMILLMFAIMIFKGILIDSRAVLDIQNEFASYHIPLLAIVIIMPFISGIITGIAIGFVGVSFPLLVPLLNQISGLSFFGYTSLAYVSGYLGMMLSPVHVCLLVTKDYFKVPLTNVYPYLIKPAIAVFCAAFLMFLVLTRLHHVL